MNKSLASRSAMLGGAKSIKTLALLLAVIAASFFATATAHTQPYARTFVSATGNDNNSCSTVTEPCLTFNGALSKTASKGEINCLGVGGFGTANISQSVTINCEGASNGGIVPNTIPGGVGIGTAGIVVNLIGLDLNGLGDSNYGVQITAAATVTIRNCKIYGFSAAGIQFNPSASGGSLVVDNVLIANNTSFGTTFGIEEVSSGGAANITVRNSTISNSDIGIFVDVNGGTHAGATIEQTTLAFNNIGLDVASSGAIAVLGGSTIVSNGTGVSNTGGTIYSFKNNQIGGNSTDGIPLTAYPGYTGGGA